MGKKISNKMMEEAGHVVYVQNEHKKKVSCRLSELACELDGLSEMNDSNNDQLDELLKNANMRLKNDEQNYEKLDVDYFDKGNELLEKYSSTHATRNPSTIVPSFNELETIEVDEISWDDYVDNVLEYANNHNISLDVDPFEALLSEDDKQMIAKRLNEDYKMEKANCDKYDYMIASFCGVVAGLIDVFFVGMPGDSQLGNWTEDMTDKFVMSVAKAKGYKPENGVFTIGHSIDFLEGKYKVNYDQATGKSANSLLGMSASNHHLKSLGHSPDLVGLIFSIVDQFVGTSHFLDNGRLITFDTDQQQLRGGNFVAKLFCGFSNWLGHLISDMAGSSTSRSKGPNHRGSGIPMPLFELFQLISSGSFKVYSNNDRANGFEDVSFADLSVKVFESGYDARFGMAQAIPVVLNEICIRLMWAMKAKFYHNKSLVESMPIGNKPELRRMLLTGHGVLCLIDGADAAIRSKGQILLFVLRLNFTAWKRLAFSGLLEVRALYRENTLNLNALEKDLESEWAVLFDESGVVM